MLLKHGFRPRSKGMTNGSSIPGKSNWVSSSLLQAVRTSSWGHPAHYSVGVGCCILGVKRPVAWTWPLTLYSFWDNFFIYIHDLQTHKVPAYWFSTLHVGLDILVDAQKEKRTYKPPTAHRPANTCRTSHRLLCPLPLSTMQYISLSSHYSISPDDLTICGTGRTQ